MKYKFKRLYQKRSASPTNDDSDSDSVSDTDPITAAAMEDVTDEHDQIPRRTRECSVDTTAATLAGPTCGIASGYFRTHRSMGPGLTDEELAKEL